MPAVYGCDLRTTEQAADAFERTCALVARRLTFRFGRKEMLMGAGRWEPQPQVRIDWRMRRVADTGLAIWETSWTEPVASDPRLEWLTEVRAGHTPTECRCAARISLLRRGDAVIEIAVPRATPDLLADILAAVPFHDIWRLEATPQVVAAARARDLADLLCHPSRRLPVVGVSVPLDRDQPLVDPDPLAARLAGVAHVVLLRDKAATMTLSDAIDNRRSVYDGAVRIWWPGFTVDADPYAHPLILRASVTPTTGDEIADGIAPLGAAHDPLAPVERQLAEAEGRARKTERRSARERARLAGGVRDEAVDQALGVVDELEAENTRLHSELAAALQRIDELNEELEAALEEPEQPPTPSDAQANRPTSVADAVRRATERCRHLVFLDEAFESAKQSPYLNPAKALWALEQLDAIAGRYKADDLPAGLIGAFDELGLPYRPDVSRTALGKYPREYRRNYRGREITLGPHLAFGAQTPRTCLRIYFWIDEDERTFIVGHVGLHLKDTTN